MRHPQMMLWAAVACAAAAGSAALAQPYEAPLDFRDAAEARFTVKPQVEKVNGQLEIRFAVSAPIDVEVAILDARGTVIRHLAAGLLGKNAPAPLQKDSLEQKITWNYRDDLGKAATDGPYRVRVCIGSQPKLEGHLGWDGSTLGGAILGMAVDTKGQLYVLDSTVHEAEYMVMVSFPGRARVRVLDKNGNYLRTIMPYPAKLSAERTAPIGNIEVDGERLPVVYNAHSANLHPLTSGMRKQRMVVHPDGYLLMTSAIGTWAVHGPSRHLLALSPNGGAPEGVGFLGPMIRAPTRRLGGDGEFKVNWFDHLAVSPGDRWIYLTQAGYSSAFKLRHEVFRLRWTDRELGAPFLGTDEPGDDDLHFDDPQGIATDRDGNLYVCDRGNDRVMVFAEDKKPLGKFAVQTPEQIAVHPASGEIYVLSRAGVRKGRWKRIPAEGSTLHKFSAWAKGPPVELASLGDHLIELMALDPVASPAKLWLAIHVGQNTKRIELRPLVDRGDSLELGDAVNNTNGLRYPMFIAVDAERQRAYVRELRGGGEGRGRGTRQRLLDLHTGKVSDSPFQEGYEIALDRAGNVYVLNNWDMYLERYDPSGEPLPFSGIGTHRIGTLKVNLDGKEEPYRAKGLFTAPRGHVVGLNGDIYMLKMSFYGEGHLDVYGPDGKLKEQNLLAHVVHGSSGFGVDAAGNIYLGANLKPGDKPMPEPFAGKVPAVPWYKWGKTDREAPWRYAYYNPYLFHWGAVFKFPPTGGEFFSGKSTGQRQAPVDGAVSYKLGYLSGDTWVKGALWRYHGYAPSPTGGLRWGDPGCTCWNARLAVDGFGRVFVPDVFRFSVDMLDTAGNQITRIGRYGNADSAGPGSKIPEPEIAFAWPAFTAVAGGKLYVSDTVNRRITVVRFEPADEAECAIP